MRRHRVAARLQLLRASLAAFLVMGLVLVLPTGAHAEEKKPGAPSAATVGLNTANAEREDGRGSYTYEVLPRGVVQDHVAVTNYRDRPITVRLFAKDATSSLNSSFDIQASADQPTDIGSWISLKKDRLTLQPNQQVVVPFQLGVPFNATPGDHAGAIVVSLLARESRPEGGTIIVDHRLGMRINLRVPGDLKPALAVEDLQVSWKGAAHVLGRGDATVSYTVRNTGNVRMKATGGLELSRVLGLPSVTAAVPAVEDLLPGGVAQYTTVVPDVLGSGPMKAAVTLRGVPVDPDLADRTTEATGRVGFNAWPWVLLAIVVGLVGLLGAGGWFERRRRLERKAAQADQAAADEKARANAKHRMLVRGALVALTLPGLLVPGFTSAATAAEGDKVPEWKATISKREGIAMEPFDLVTSGGCPLPATAMIAYGYGRGFPAEGAIVVSNSDGPVTNERGFTAALADSMKNLMAVQPRPQALEGTYRFELRCIEPEFPDKSYGNYVAAIRFDKQDRWVALPPLTTKKGPVISIPTTGPDGEPLLKPGSGAAPGAGTAGAPGAAGTDPAAAGRAADILATGEADDGSGPSWPLLAAGIAVAVGSLLLAFGRRLPGPWRRT